MKSLRKKWLPGILVAGLVALVVGAAGATPATAAASDAQVSALTKAQKRAKAKALRACNKRKNVRQRRACARNVNKRFARIAKRQKPKPAPKGQTHRVMVSDPYFYSPNQLDIKVNDSILWDWKNATGREPHDVTPTSVPPKVNRNDFKSPLMTGPNYTFKRQFTTAGSYSFVCSIHFLMTMNVNVKK